MKFVNTIPTYILNAVVAGIRYRMGLIIFVKVVNKLKIINIILTHILDFTPIDIISY